MTPEQVAAIRRLIAAAKPFTDGDLVDETMGTIPKMEELERAIEAAEAMLERGDTQ